MNCNNSISIEQVEDVCNGKRLSTTCVIHPSIISLLSLPANSTQEEINNAFVLAISSLINRVEELENQLYNYV